MSYRTTGDELQVVIDRCPIRGECTTMAKSSVPLGEGRTTEVRVPFHGKRIVMLHTDGTQQVLP